MKSYNLYIIISIIFNLVNFFFLLLFKYTFLCLIISFKLPKSSNNINSKAQTLKSWDYIYNLSYSDSDSIMIDDSQNENENEDVDSTGKVLNFESTDNIIRPNDLKVFF